MQSTIAKHKNLNNPIENRFDKYISTTLNLLEISERTNCRRFLFLVPEKRTITQFLHFNAPVRSDGRLLILNMRGNLGCFLAYNQESKLNGSTSK